MATSSFEDLMQAVADLAGRTARGGHLRDHPVANRVDRVSDLPATRVLVDIVVGHAVGNH